MNDEINEIISRLNCIDEEIRELSFSLSRRPSHDFLDAWLKDSKQNYENHITYVNNRMSKLEQDYKSIDPKYLSMTTELSEANDNMIRLNLDRHRHLADVVSQLSRRVAELEKDK